MNAETQVAERHADKARNLHGSFIWYELMTHDPDAAKRFYDHVVGWTIEAAPSGEMDYRMIDTGTGLVGGVMRLTEAMTAADARPGWLGYIGVDDVDATVASVTASGGSVLMPAYDIPGIGRLALLADPQGAPFYIMRGASDDASNAFSPMQNGHGAWNELVTSDQAAALAFYQEQFGWTKGDVMPMGAMGDYQFIEHGGEMIGAIMTGSEGGRRPTWGFCFRVPDIDEAHRRATESGATITHGPMEVPGGDMVVQAIDPEGAAFMLVAPGNNWGGRG